MSMFQKRDNKNILNGNLPKSFLTEEEVVKSFVEDSKKAVEDKSILKIKNVMEEYKKKLEFLQKKQSNKDRYNEINSVEEIYNSIDEIYKQEKYCPRKSYNELINSYEQFVNNFELKKNSSKINLVNNEKKEIVSDLNRMKHFLGKEYDDVWVLDPEKKKELISYQNNMLARLEEIEDKELSYLKAEEDFNKSKNDLIVIIEKIKRAEKIEIFKESLKNGNVSEEAQNIFFQKLAHEDFSLHELESIFLEKDERSKGESRQERWINAGEKEITISQKFNDYKIALVSVALYKLNLISKIMIPDNDKKNDAIAMVEKMGFSTKKEAVLVKLQDVDNNKYKILPYHYHGNEASCLVAQETGQAIYILKQKFDKTKNNSKRDLLDGGAGRIYWRFDDIENLCERVNEKFSGDMAPAIIVNILPKRIEKILEKFNRQRIK